MLVRSWFVAVIASLFIGLAGCSGSGGDKKTSPTGPTLERIEVIPMQSQIAAGATAPFQATGFYDNGTKQDLTTNAVWTSSNDAVAAVSNSQDSVGLVLGRAAGTATVSANVNDIVGSGRLTVASLDLRAIEVLAEYYNFAPGTTQALTAYGLFEDSSRYDVTKLVTWTSSDPAVVAVDAGGTISAVAVGTATISAKYGDFSSDIPLTVQSTSLTRIHVVSDITEFPVGTAQVLSAVGTFDNHTTQDLNTLDWQSSNADVIRVEMQGSQVLAYAVATGTVTISATDKTSGLHGDIQLTARSAQLTGIEVYAETNTLTKAETLDLTATGVFDNGDHPDLTASEKITWKSSDESVITVSNATGSAGRISAVTIGQATISAETIGADSKTISGNVLITVNDATLEGISISAQGGADVMVIGSTLSLTATGTFSDGSSRNITENVDWRSSPSGAVAISDGLVTAISEGEVTISAYSGSEPQQSGTYILQVVNALDHITVTPEAAAIALGTAVQMTATGVFADGNVQDLTNQVDWNSSSQAVVDVANGGRAEAVSEGVATISAALGGVSGSTTLTVTAATLQSIEIISPQTDVPVGTSVDLTAEALFSDGSRQNIGAAEVYWTSSDETVVEVTNAAQAAGRVKAKAVGSSTVTASYAEKTAEIAINTVHVPQAPASLSVYATANVILNDGSDYSTIKVAVGAAEDGAVVADGTLVTFAVDVASGNLTQASATTVGGVAEVNLTSVAGYTGALRVDVAVANTNLTSRVQVYTIADLADVIWRARYFGGTITNGIVKKDSYFALFIYNLSNRTFGIRSFRFANGNDVRTISDSGSLNGGQLPGGAYFFFPAILQSDFQDNGFSVSFELEASPSQAPFYVTGTFDLPLNVP